MTQRHSQDREAAAAHLTQRVAELLREQPLQRAPATLAVRVMAALELRQHSAFQRWPLVVRIGFVALAALTGQFTLQIGMWVHQLMHTSLAMPRPPVLVALAETALALSQHLPAIWFYGTLALLALIYGGLFGVSVALYRTVSPSHH